MCSLHAKSNAGSLQATRNFDLSVLMEILSELTVTMVQVSEGTEVSTQGQHYVQGQDYI